MDAYPLGKKRAKTAEQYHVFADETHQDILD
jgi:hypothetical protein